MKKFKKNNLFILLVLVLCSLCVFDLDIQVNAEVTKVDTGNATYRVSETVETCRLGYGVTYQRDIALSSVQAGHFSGNAAGSGGGGSLVSGQEYQQQVNWLDIAYDSEVELIPYATLQGKNWNTSTVRNAALDFETKNPGYMVVAAINGDWFQISLDIKASSGVTISNGEYYKPTTDHGGANTLVFNNSGTGTRITEISYNTVVPTLTIYDENGNQIKKVYIDKVNQEPEAGEIALYYANITQGAYNYQDKFNTQPVTNAWVSEKPQQAVTAVINTIYAKGEINYTEGEYVLNRGTFAIKTNNSEIDDLLADGVTIRCQYEYESEEYKDVTNAICFPYPVMYDGEGVYSPESGKAGDGKARKPRTVIGQREDGSLVLATIDGRQPTKNMYGMTSMEMAALMTYYGCTDAWKLDGGGSATMIIRKQSGFTISSSFNDSASSDWYVVNSPSDGAERSDGNCLLVAVKVPEVTIDVSEVTCEYVIFNVALLTELEKNYELYVLVNGKEHLVVNGEVKISSLKQNTEYDCYVYYKDGDEFNNLGVKQTLKLALPKPTTLEVNVSMKSKGDEKLVEIYFKFDNRNAVRKIQFYVDEEKVSTNSFTSYLSQSQELYDALTDLEVSVLISTSDLIDNETLVFSNIKTTYSLEFILDELLFSTNDTMKDIFSSNE